VKGSESAPDFLWQMAIVTQPHVWSTVAVPFRELMLTRRGRIELDQTPLDPEHVHGVSQHPPGGSRSDATRARAACTMPAHRQRGSFHPPASPTTRCAPQLGLLLADGRNGPFRIEIAHIGVIRDFAGGAYASGGQWANEAAQRVAESARGALPLPGAAPQPAASAGVGAAASRKPLTEMSAEELREHYRKEREAAKLKK
jgi:hypothetical protein